jgi:hypothetical protein
MQEQDGGSADSQHRDSQAAQVQPVLADLADNQQDEDRVDEVRRVSIHDPEPAANRPSARRPADGHPG